MKTIQFDGKHVAEFDEALKAKLRLSSATEKAVKSERMLVGIRNDNNEIYRAIGVTGLDKFLGLINDLTKMGLSDELADQDNPKGGYDAIFSKG